MSVSECQNLSTGYFQVDNENSNIILINVKFWLLVSFPYSADSARNCDEMIEERNDLKD